MDINERIRELGLTLPEPAPVGGIYTPVRQSGRQLYVSGQGPTVAGKPAFTGKVGGELTIEQAQEAARLCALTLLAAVKKYTGDLNRVEGVVKVLALVASAPEFGSQPAVVNAASQLLVDVFGEKGWHARSAMGTNELPGNIPVEIEAIFELRDE